MSAMILLGFADIHGEPFLAARLSAEIAAADLILLAGDLTQFGGEADAQRVVEAFRRFNPNLVTVPGNCDHVEVEGWLQSQHLSIHARHVIRDGIAFVGVGGSLPCPGLGTPLEQRDDAFEQLLDKTMAAVPAEHALVLLSHQPPFGTINDLAGRGRHVGSKSIQHFIETHRPLICFTGHIHEGRGIGRIGDTQIVNPGPFRQGGYAYAQVQNGRVQSMEIRNAA